MQAQSVNAAMSAHEVLHAHEMLCDLSDQMLALAKGRNWDQLIDCESHYIDAIEKLGSMMAHEPMDEEQISLKAAYLERAMVNNRDITELLMSRRNEVQEIIANETQKKALNASYGPPQLVPSSKKDGIIDADV